MIKSALYWVALAIFWGVQIGVVFGWQIPTPQKAIAFVVANGIILLAAYYAAPQLARLAQRLSGLVGFVAMIALVLAVVLVAGLFVG